MHVNISSFLQCLLPLKIMTSHWITRSNVINIEEENILLLSRLYFNHNSSKVDRYKQKMT